MWWGPQKHKKDPLRNKGHTNLKKNNLQGNNSGVDEAKTQINYLEHKEAKNQS